MRLLPLAAALLAACTSSSLYRVQAPKRLLLAGDSTSVVIRAPGVSASGWIAVGVVWGDGQLSSRVVHPNDSAVITEGFTHVYTISGVYVATASVATHVKVVWYQRIRIEVL